MRADDDPEKQRMKGQTEVKHSILEKYLRPWLFKITEIGREVRYVDGFAGWGRYDDGSPGSPLIAMSVAEELIEEEWGRIGSKLDFFFCDFIETDDSNYEDLEREVKKAQESCPRKIKAQCHHKEFEDYARDYIERKGQHTQPAFIFIDPFGFSGLPFEVVSDVLNLRSSGMELFITFTAGEMARFIDSNEHIIAIDRILGTERWKSEIEPDLTKEEIAQELLRIYENQLREEAGVKYVWPFRMSRESKRETVYFLVHATNNFHGFKLMKDIMYREGAEDQFAYLGPDHYPFIDEQQDLGSFGGGNHEEQKKIENLAEDLHRRFRDRNETYTLWELMEKTYEETPLIETHYRKAGKLLRDQNKAEIIHHPERPNGREKGSTGLGKDDEIRFIRTTFDQFR